MYSSKQSIGWTWKIALFISKNGNLERTITFKLEMLPWTAKWKSFNWLTSPFEAKFAIWSCVPNQCSTYEPGLSYYVAQARAGWGITADWEVGFPSVFAQGVPIQSRPAYLVHITNQISAFKAFLVTNRRQPISHLGSRSREIRTRKMASEWQ